MFEDLLMDQAARHPGFSPQDAVKLCYQATFGPAHMLECQDAAKAYFQQEFEECPVTEEPLYEEISPDMLRVNLGAWKREGLSPLWLFSLFEMTAELEQKGEEAFRLFLQSTEELAGEGKMPFSREAFLQFLREYLRHGVRAISHSEGYRRENQPSYRLVGNRYRNLILTLCAIAKDRTIRVIAIDGKAGAGKSTIAMELQRVLGCAIVHMDDFFLPPELRTPERMNEPGGNIHYERFQEEVLPKLGTGGDFSFRRFDCGKMDYGEEVHIKPGRLCVVEGSYSCHPSFGDYMDLRIFMDASEEIQRERIQRRGLGETMETLFFTRWIPMELAYHDAFGIRQRADLVLRT